MLKVDGLMMVESKMITKGGDDVDVGCGNAFGSGGGEDEGVDSSVQQVNNVIDSFQYTETQIGGPNDFKAWIKEYMNAVVLKLREKGKPKEEIQAFKAQAPGIAKFLLKNFSDVQFYLGASFVADSMVFSIYPEGAVTPNFYYIMGGMAAEKF
jgi:Translationally controlled tumour protein